MQLQLLRADGTPASDAVVSIAEAPGSVSMPDLAMVTDASGRLSVDAPVAGRYVLSVWSDGRAQRLPCELAPGAATRVLTLPA